MTSTMNTAATGGHLAERVRPLLEDTDERRIEYILTERWIPYTRATEVLRRLEDLLIRPRTQRMPNMLLVGETNNGKSSIVNRFQRLHPCEENAQRDGNVMPVICVQVPPEPSENRLYNAILEHTGAPFRPVDRVEAKQLALFRLMRHLNVRMLILDEIHHILAGAANRQRQILNVLKYMGNELQIPIVAVGTYAAFNAIQTDAQLANRFRPEELPKWGPGIEWDRLVLSFERRLPLRKPSDLSAPDLKAKLLVMSEGLIGELSNLLNDAAVEAIRSGKERIDGTLLGAINWLAPSQRKHRR